MKKFTDLNEEYQQKLIKLVEYLFNTTPVISKYPANNPGTDKEDAEHKVIIYDDTFSLAWLAYHRIPEKMVEIWKNDPQNPYVYSGWHERQFAIAVANTIEEMIDAYMKRCWELWRVVLWEIATKSEK
jgi:hypothetical protein